MHLLTTRDFLAGPPLTVGYSYENIFVSSCGAKMLQPKHKKILTSHGRGEGLKPRLLKKVLNSSTSIYKNKNSLQQQYEETKDSDSCLLVIAMNAGNLRVLDSINNWRNKFSIVAAYVLDAWVLEAFPEATEKLDHIFVPYPEVADLVSERFVTVPVSVVPHGYDVLNEGSFAGNRQYDIATYGRTSESYHKHLTSADTFSYIYQNDSWTHNFPSKHYSQEREDQLAKNRLTSMLGSSQIALAFENNYTSRVNQSSAHIIDRLNVSILTQRWFECLAKGCVVAGKQPQSVLTSSYLGWENATIELPDDPVAGSQILEGILADTELLEKTRKLNYYNSLSTNDWRWRIQQILQTLSLSEPSSLKKELLEIQTRYKAYESNTLA